jgi:signal transduction histidine kinase
VLDDGKAIPENEWEKIFQKHYRVDSQDGPDGNGLGLYLVQKIVEAHEGRIYPRKCEEMKTCFVIELPTMEQI